MPRQPNEIDHVLEAFKETWPAFQREGIDTRYPDTDTVRTAWPKPTLYREHEIIHLLCNVIDHLRREVAGPDKGEALARVREWVEGEVDDWYDPVISPEMHDALRVVVGLPSTREPEKGHHQDCPVRFFPDHPERCRCSILAALETDV